MKKSSPQGRRKLLAQELRKLNLDAAIISDPKHFHYFTGLRLNPPMVQGTKPPSFLVAASDSSTVTLVGASDLVNPFFGDDEIVTSRDFLEGPIYTFGDYEIEDRIIAYPDFVSEELCEVLREMKDKGRMNFESVGIEDWHLTEAYRSAISREFPSAQFTSLSKKIVSMREVKGTDEIACIREAAKRLDQAFEIVKPQITAGTNESGLNALVNSKFPNRYDQSASVFGDVLSGYRTLDVVGAPTNKVLRDGETVIIDLKTCYSNYWARAARTFVVGKPNEEQIRTYELLLRIREKAESLLKPGAKGRELYEFISAEIVRAGYQKGLIHQAGHGVGLDDREAPFLIPNSEEELVEGTACVLEVGTYEPSTGGMRIGDCFVISGNGNERLSHFSTAFS